MSNSSTRTRTSSSRANAFTLIEVLNGIVIFALGMLALTQLQGSLARNSTDSNARTVAANIAEGTIETARRFSQITSDGVKTAYNDIVDGTETIPRVLATQDGKDLWVDQGGSCWRATSFIEAAQPFDTVQDLEHAGEIGFALGMFHHLLDDLPSDRLADTLEGFHIAPRYLRHFDDVLARSCPESSPEVRYALEFIDRRRDVVHVLEQAKAQGKLRLRAIHGDPKVNNIMMDTATRRAVAMVDLDTVKPGLVHYDIGDCLRSCCNPLGEDLEQWDG